MTTMSHNNKPDNHDKIAMIATVIIGVIMIAYIAIMGVFK